jgi:hypothetical protein
VPLGRLEVARGEGLIRRLQLLIQSRRQWGERGRILWRKVDHGRVRHSGQNHHGQRRVEDKGLWVDMLILQGLNCKSARRTVTNFNLIIKMHLRIKVIDSSIK